MAAEATDVVKVSAVDVGGRDGLAGVGAGRTRTVVVGGDAGADGGDEGLLTGIRGARIDQGCGTGHEGFPPYRTTRFFNLGDNPIIYCISCQL